MAAAPDMAMKVLDTVMQDRGAAWDTALAHLWATTTDHLRTIY
jgi:hypothetical protein